MKPKEYSVTLNISAIRQSPFHFRKESVSTKLEELAASIQEVGLIHAVSVVEDQNGGVELINGHRRLLAHRHAGLPTIRANVYEYEPEELADPQRRQQAIVQFLLAANSAEPLIPVERARYYEDAMNKFGWEAADIARVHHLDEQHVLDDLLFLNLDEKVLDLVQAHPDSFTQDALRVLAEHASPREKRGWTITRDEQIAVAEQLALQKDKRLNDSTRALRGHITEMVKKRRNEAKDQKRKLDARGDDPVKALFKLIESVSKATSDLTSADLSSITAIDPRDKGVAYERVLASAQELIDFADGRLQGLKSKPTTVRPNLTAAAV